MQDFINSIDWQDDDEYNERKDIIYFDLIDVVIYLIGGLIVGKIISMIIF